MLDQPCSFHGSSYSVILSPGERIKALKLKLNSHLQDLAMIDIDAIFFSYRSHSVMKQFCLFSISVILY